MWFHFSVHSNCDSSTLFWWKWNLLTIRDVNCAQKERSLTCLFRPHLDFSFLDNGPWLQTASIKSKSTFFSCLMRRLKKHKPYFHLNERWKNYLIISWKYICFISFQNELQKLNDNLATLFWLGLYCDTFRNWKTSHVQF